MFVMIIKRELQERIEQRLISGKVILLFGPRRVGKTILIGEILKKFAGRTLLLNGEDANTLALLAERSISNYRNLLNNIELLVIDEAQNIPGIGNILKLIIDEVAGIKVIASGSSSFDLLNKAGEPLTGRSFSFRLLPISQSELSINENILETRQNLETRLIFGSFPEVITLTDKQMQKEYLLDIVTAYLLKDLLSLDGLRNASKLRDLLVLLAYQVGREVSMAELGSQLGLSKNTVEKYLDLLSKVFVIFRIGGYSGNLRKEISKNVKWYFYDNGIRNALIGNFNPISIRQDVGLLWENYLISERMKKKANNSELIDFYFWRTYDGQEIDLIESNVNSLNAFEIKWKDKKVKIPAAWQKNYPEAIFKIISPENYLTWIIKAN
jgi:predicted AAA+ superfamily ATPase